MSKQLETAQPVIISVVGTTGAGKSTKAREIAADLGGKQLIIVDSPLVQGWEKVKPIEPTAKNLQFKTGKRRIFAENHDKEDFWKTIIENFRDGTIICDDARDYINSNLEHNGSFDKLLRRHRHISVDIIFVVHQFSDLPPKTWGYNKWIFIGKLSSIPEKKELRRNKDEIINTCKMVNDGIKEMEAKGKSAWGYFYCMKNQ